MARVWYSPTVRRIDVYVDDRKPEDKRLRWALEDYMKATGLSRNKAVKKLLGEALEGKKVFVQQRLTDYGHVPESQAPKWTEVEVRRQLKEARRR